MSEPTYTPPDLSLFGDEHVRQYEETGGEVGHLWNGATILVLTTIGRTSGEPRKFALIYDTRGADFVVVASAGGSPDHPGWYKNLLAHPDASVQVRGDTYDVRARTAEGPERNELWQLMTRSWPNYDSYVTRTDRRIPVVVLEPR